MSLSTPQEWADAADALARERGQRKPDKFPIALGIDHPEAMSEWFTQDAIDTLENFIPDAAQAFVSQGVEPQQAVKNAIASALATHSQMALELGLWLAQTGRVKL